MSPQRAGTLAVVGVALVGCVALATWGGGEVLTHGGSNTMFYSVIWLAPKRDFAVVVCTNVGGDPGTKATDQAAARLIQDYLKEPTP